MTEAEYREAIYQSALIEMSHRRRTHASIFIAELAKEARLQTLRAEMLEAKCAWNAAVAIADAEADHRGLPSMETDELMATAKRSYDEARKAWILMGGKD